MLRTSALLPRVSRRAAWAAIGFEEARCCTRCTRCATEKDCRFSRIMFRLPSNWPDQQNERETLRQRQQHLRYETKTAHHPKARPFGSVFPAAKPCRRLRLFQVRVSWPKHRNGSSSDWKKLSNDQGGSQGAKLWLQAAGHDPVGQPKFR